MVNIKENRLLEDLIPDGAELQSHIPLVDRVKTPKGQEISRELREAVAELYRDHHRDNPLRLDYIAEIRVDVAYLDDLLHRHRENRIPALLDGSPLGDPPPGCDPLADLVRRLNAGELNERTMELVLSYQRALFIKYDQERGKRVRFFEIRGRPARMDDAVAGDLGNDRDGDRDGQEAGNA